VGVFFVEGRRGKKEVGALFAIKRSIREKLGRRWFSAKGGCKREQ
jgi:hypothetical protein